MTTIFSTGKSVKNKFSQRILRIESLENRELLSVSPLGVDYPDFVQTADTAQNFHTEHGGLMLDELWTTYHSVTFEYAFDTNDYYKLCVAEIGTKITGTIAQGTTVSAPSADNEGMWTVTGLTAGKTYYFEVWKSADNGLSDPFVKETDIEEIPFVTIPSTADAKLVKNGYGFDAVKGSYLDLSLHELPLGYTKSDISITGTYGISGTENVINLENIDIDDGNAGLFNVGIYGLRDGDKVKITKIVIGSDIELFAGREFNAVSEPTAETPTANVLSSLSGITSSAVTLTWTKPTQAQSDALGNPLVDVTLKYDKKDITTDYKITIDDDTGNPNIYYSQGKTNFSVTDLIPEALYYSYKIEAKLTAKDSGNTLLKNSDGYTVLASGLFETEYPTLANFMAVGQPTEVKTIPTDTNVKITWKPPVNYNGGYKIIIANKSYLTTGFFFVAAGAKTEAVLNINNSEFISGTNQNLWTLRKGNRYELVILPITGNVNDDDGLTSTPTNFLAQKTQTDPPVTITTSAAPVPALAPENILSAKSISNIEYNIGTGYSTVRVTMEEYENSGKKILPEQYYAVLRDANKAIIANEEQFNGFFQLDANIILSPKSKYTVEIYGVVGTTISTAKTTQMFTVADYPAATVRLTSGTNVSLNEFSVTAANLLYNNYHYLQYTSIVDAKGKPDWSTADVEKLDSNNSTYVIGSETTKLKLMPNTQYYVRVVTANVNVAHKGGSPYFNQWVSGNEDSWWEATRVVFSKELKVKTAAVPLAVISKFGLSVDKQSNIALKAVGQTMLAAKDAGNFFGTDKPLNGASFNYMLIVSTDSKVDKVTGKLIGGTEIDLYPSDITITALPVKKSNPIADGQFTIECALTGNDGYGIFETMGLSAANISSLKTLNFQLATIVNYGNNNNSRFISLTKPSKVAMPKWFV
jgi:hypothetical protein